MDRHHAHAVAARLHVALDGNIGVFDLVEEIEQRRRLALFEGERQRQKFVDRVARLRPEPLLVVVLVAFAGLIAMGGTRSVRRTRARSAAALARDTILTQAQIARGVTRRSLAPTAAVTQAEPPAELRRRVANLAPGTYIDDILAEQDSTLYRWPERLSDALRVYVEPTSAVPGMATVARSHLSGYATICQN